MQVRRTEHQMTSRAANSRVPLLIATALVLALFLAGCAAGNERFSIKPAGFLVGLWHGAIALVTFVISLFKDNVHMYETRNAGEGYDAGFLLGALIVWGGIFRSRCTHPRRKDPCGRDWEQIGDKIEQGIRDGVRGWAEESKCSSEEWKEIAGKIEEKIKRELRNWADR